MFIDSLTRRHHCSATKSHFVDSTTELLGLEVVPLGTPRAASGQVDAMYILIPNARLVVSIDFSGWTDNRVWSLTLWNGCAARSRWRP